MYEMEEKIMRINDFDPIFALNESDMVDRFIDRQMKMAGLTDEKGYLPQDILNRKNILNVIYAVLVLLYVLAIFFHFQIIVYIVGLTILVLFWWLFGRYDLKKYIKKEVKSRQSEKISNIVMTVKMSMVPDESKKRKVVLIVAAVLLPCILFIKPRIFYEKSESGYTVRFYAVGLTNMTEAVIPSEHKGEAVEAIRGNVFSNMPFLEKVILPDSVVEIRGQAFKNDKRLTEISLPANLEYLGGGAFYNCTSLTQIELPDSVTYMGGETFYHCESLVMVKLSNQLTEIRGNTFENCTRLERIEIPDRVTRIGGHAFRGDTSLCKVIVSPNSQLEEIGSSAFRGCYAMEEITLPANVYINEKAFKENDATINYYE